MENLKEEAIYEMTVLYDDYSEDDLELEKSISDSIMNPNEHRMSSLGLSDESLRHQGVKLDVDKITCDIESLTPVQLRQIIANLKPNLYDYELKLDHHTIHGNQTFHTILKELHMLKKINENPTIEVHCCKIAKIPIQPEEFGF